MIHVNTTFFLGGYYIPLLEEILMLNHITPINYILKCCRTSCIGINMNLKLELNRLSMETTLASRHLQQQNDKRIHIFPKINESDASTCKKNDKI